MRRRSPLRKPRRARLLTSGLVVAALSLIFAPSAFAGFWTPESGGSPQADNIDSLYKIILYMAAVVFVIVVGALLYSTYAFRAKKHPIAQQIHGNTRLEIGWTAGAAGILVILSIVTFVKLNGIVNPPNSNAGTAAVLSANLSAPTPPDGKHLTVCVQARQFFWRYVYGTGCNLKGWQKQLPYSYEEMEAPKGVTVDLLIQSSDVIHAWWIPSFGGKVDAVPGYTTYTWFKAERDGVFRGQCAQLCGRQHAFMTAQVRVVSPAQYTAWLSRQKQLIQTGNDQVGQLRQQLIQKGYLTSNGIF